MAFSLALVLVLPVLVSFFSGSILVPCRMCRRTLRQHVPGCCRRHTKVVFLLVERQLCVNTFPVLFKLHKTHSKMAVAIATYISTAT